jgi:hypothetical protein
MHRLSDPQQPAGARFGKAAVREIEDEKAERNSLERK